MTDLDAMSQFKRITPESARMIVRPRISFACVAIALSISAVLSGCGRDHVDFNADIRPILNDQCVTCHGGVKTNAELNLQFRELALKGGKSGNPAIVPGDADASELIRKVSHTDPSDRMPKDSAPLTDEQIKKLRSWIDDGAEWVDHWAYVVPEWPEIPVEDQWIKSPIDAFVLEKLRDAGLEPADEAGCEILARRVSLDLTGLPPTLEQANSLCTSHDYPALVDQLLASPAFGERWAALWLDLARYADSKGYEADRTRSIWRFRDWVITAFNDDMPFDQFTIEQLAGDLLPEPNVDQLIATAFNRNAMTNEEGGTDDEEHRIAAVMDRVNTTWEVYQGTTMRCTQCHGHPYDPFVQSDYYSSFALFNNTADWDQPDEEPVLREFSAGTREEGERLLEQLAAVDAEIVDFASTPELLAVRTEWEANLHDPAVAGGLSTTAQNEVLRIAKIPRSERSGHQEMFIRDRFAEIHESTAELRKQRRQIAGEINALAPTITPIMTELPVKDARITHRFERGSFLSPLESVSPGVPGSMSQLPDGISANRLSFALWLVSGENPLTARVTVNRFWEQLFGFGIVESADDFGTVGIPPTHPELLDWLALHFSTDLGWSVKGILRELVTSASYQQSSIASARKLEVDPRNQLISRGPRFRLSAEQLRDQALSVGGLLSQKQFGPSVMPPQPEGIWTNPYNGQQWIVPEGEDRYRRALYTYWRRTSPYPAMATFDAPSRELCISRRIRTNTPLQALVTLNDPAYWEAAEGLARRMETEVQPGASTRERVSHGYRIALAREPSEKNLDVLTELADESSLALAANAIMNLDEFLTKE